MPSWSVFERRMVRMIPSRTRSKSMRLIAASSERLRPHAKSDQQQSPISEVLEPISHCPENDKEVFTEKWGRLTLCCPVFTPHTPHGRPDEGGVDGARQALSIMSNRDRRQPSGQRCNLQGRGLLGQISSKLSLGRGYVAAPSSEVFEVSLVSAP
jgi:hypothetical protein